MKTTVVSVETDYDIYIGRTSKWGNPFKIGTDGSRAQVIEKYREHIRTQSHLLTALSELRGKRLGCHCAPLPCHGDVLAKLADANADYVITCDGGNNWTGRYKLETRDGQSAHQNVTLRSEDSPHMAEYRALLAALLDLTARITAAHKAPNDFTVHILTKSELVVEQIAGRYRVNAQNLQPLHTRTNTLLKQFKHANLTKSPRHEIIAALTH